MCQVPGSPLPYSWYDGISLIGPCRPLFALHADISRKKCDFLQVLSIGHLAFLFSTSFACVLIEHSFTRISNSYQISLQNIYGYQLCSCILSLQHIQLMQLTIDSPKYLMIERQTRLLKIRSGFYADSAMNKHGAIANTTAQGPARSQNTKGGRSFGSLLIF